MTVVVMVVVVMLAVSFGGIAGGGSDGGSGGVAVVVVVMSRVGSGDGGGGVVVVVVVGFGIAGDRVLRDCLKSGVGRGLVTALQQATAAHLGWREGVRIPGQASACQPGDGCPLCSV